MVDRQSLADLGRMRGAAAVVAEAEPEIREPKIDALGRAYATGRRKDAVARVWVKRGTGKFMIKCGGKLSPKVKKDFQAAVKATPKGETRPKREPYRNLQTYFARSTLQMIVLQPFAAVDRLGQYDVMCSVSGGGLSGQAGAVRHGISRALTNFDPTLRPALKAGGFLTRDAREVERKKYGRAKARRSFQFSKR